MSLVSLIAPRSYWRDAIVVFSVTMCVMDLAEPGIVSAILGELVLAWRKSKGDSARIDQFLESIHEYETEVIALKKRLVYTSTVPDTYNVIPFSD